MADEAAPPAATPAPAPVDPRAEALKAFAPAAEAAQDPKAPAPSVSEAGTPAEAKTEGAPDTAAPVAAEEKPAEQEPKLREGYARLARDKAKLLADRRAVDADRAALTSWRETQAKVKASPAAVLEAHGLTLEQVAEDYLKREAGTQAPSTDDRVNDIAARLAAREAAETKATETAAEQQRHAAVEAGVNVVKDIVTASASDFPTIAALGEHRQVFDALGQYAQRHGLAPADITTDLVTVVAREVEKALNEEMSGLVEKVPHIAQRAQAPAKPAAGQPTRQGAQGTSAVTLASSAVSEAPPPQPRRGYTTDELRKLALAQFSKDSPAA